MRSGYWRDLTSGELAGLDPETTVALLPVAAVEQHGPHLPLGTDALIAAGIVRETRPRVPAPAALLVLPVLEIGHSPEHTAFPGTLSIAAETLLAGWIDVARSAGRSGIRKLVILNSHGGQKGLVDLAAVRLRVEHAMLVVRASYFSLGAPAGLFDELERRHDLHGGERETSLMLHLHPELVQCDRIADFAGLPERFALDHEILGVERPAGYGWASQDLHPDGVCGNAAAADAGKGRRYLEHIADRLARLIAEVAATPLAVLREGPLPGR